MTKRTSRPLLLLLGALAAPGAARAADAPTFTRDVAPLVFKHCAACHRPGEVAPFSLLTYPDVKKRAGLIREVTASRTMPPWKPVPGHGEFRGVRRLTDDEIALLRRWAEAGAPEGDPGDLPPAPQFAAGWQLGAPDMIVTMPKPYTVPAEGPDVYRNFVIPIQIPEGKYVRAVEFRPGNRRVVHHAILSLDPTGKQRERDGKDGAPGFTQVNIAGMVLTGSLGFWVPGKEPRPLPDGVALAWPRGADFILQLHLHPSGKPEVEQSTVGFYFTDEKPRRSVGGVVLQERKIDIPPGEANYRTKDTKTLKADTAAYGIFPHMHLIGKDVKVTAVLPDGSRRPLLWIDRWDFNWQNYYEYATPVPLPKGTQVVMECMHDNSADNPSNPHQPPQRITYGEQTANEMAIVLLNTISDAPPALAKLSPADLARQAGEALRLFDTDKDGKLSADELGRIPGVAGQDPRALVARFDRDGDGMLNAAEIAEAIAALRRR